MIFTAAYKPSMDRALSAAQDKGEQYMRPGEGDGHATRRGAVCFETREQAQAWIDHWMKTNQSTSGYAVYGLDCELSNTSPVKGEEAMGVRRLVKAAAVVAL